MQGQAHYTAGVAYYKDGNYKLAIECFLLATEAEPANADYHEQLGITWFHHGDKEAALECLERAQTLEPENPYRYSSRAYVRDSLGDTEGAVADYRIAVELDPDDAVAWNNLGLLEEKLGYKQAAAVKFKRADQLAEEFGFGPSMQPKEVAESAESQPKKEIPVVDASADAPDEEEPSSGSIGSELRRAILTRAGRKEFWEFLKNGFRIKE